jgi:hypothetical protein
MSDLFTPMDWQLPHLGNHFKHTKLKIAIEKMSAGNSIETLVLDGQELNSHILDDLAKAIERCPYIHDFTILTLENEAQTDLFVEALKLFRNMRSVYEVRVYTQISKIGDSVKSALKDLLSSVKSLQFFGIQSYGSLAEKGAEHEIVHCCLEGLALRDSSVSFVLLKG